MDQSAAGSKRVHFEAERNRKYRSNKLSKRQEARREQLYFFQKFNAVNYYYKKVNLQRGPGLVPSFYRFKVAPIDVPELARVYEIEEHIGRPFIDELAEMHLSHLKQRANAAKKKKVSKTGLAAALDDLEDEVNAGTQQSLPAFLMGNQLAKLVKKLEGVKADDMVGAGALKYNQKAQEMRGGCKSPQEYYDYNKKKYEKMMSYVKPFLPLYISQLEVEIISAKFDALISSLTFKYSRQAEMLRLIPDRVTSATLRINSTVAIRNDDAAAGGYYKELYGDPDRPKDLEKHVVSVLDAIQLDRVVADKATRDLREAIEKKLNPKESDLRDIGKFTQMFDAQGFRLGHEDESGKGKLSGKLID